MMMMMMTMSWFPASYLPRLFLYGQNLRLDHFTDLKGPRGKGERVVQVP